LVVINGCLQYEKKQNNYARFAPQTKATLWGWLLMLNLANSVYCLKSLFLLSVLFLCVSCILCFGSVGGVLSEFLPSVAREQIGFLKSFCSVSCPLWVSHGLLCVIFVVCVPSFLMCFKPSNYAIYFHYICNRLKCVFSSFSGSLFIFNYVLTFGSIENYKALFYRASLTLTASKSEVFSCFWGVNV